MELAYKDDKINFKIKENTINGIYTKQIESIRNIFELNLEKIEFIKINNKKVNEKDIFQVKRKIEYIDDTLQEDIHENNLHEYMISIIKSKRIYPKNIAKKLIDALKIVGLDSSLLDKNIYTLSTSETKLVQIAISLLSNPDIIILNNPFKCLDLKNRKKLMIIIKRLRDQHNKTFVIITDDTEILIQYADYSIIFINNSIIASDETMKLFKNVELLRKHKIEIPKIIEFSYEANKKKQAGIDYFKDVRDIIKDIYKHV